MAINKTENFAGVGDRYLRQPIQFLENFGSPRQLPECELTDHKWVHHDVSILKQSH
jgi:hypothetical protein